MTGPQSSPEARRSSLKASTLVAASEWLALQGLDRAVREGMILCATVQPRLICLRVVSEPHDERAHPSKNADAEIRLESPGLASQRCEI